MRSRATILVLVVAVALVGLGVAGLGPFTPVFHRPIPISANGGVVEVDLVPIPEGPPSVPFQRTPTAQPFRPLAQIERFIPDPLPAPLFQGLCGMGGNMVVTLGNGKQVTYGPCYRPASIDHLWAEMLYVEENGQCAPRCGPGGAKGP
jgi:hypothetical protein